MNGRLHECRYIPFIADLAFITAHPLCEYVLKCNSLTNLVVSVAVTTEDVGGTFNEVSHESASSIKGCTTAACVHTHKCIQPCDYSIYPPTRDGARGRQRSPIVLMNARNAIAQRLITVDTSIKMHITT